jgi:hypothetical protein
MRRQRVGGSDGRKPNRKGLPADFKLFWCRVEIILVFTEVLSDTESRWHYGSDGTDHYLGDE